MCVCVRACVCVCASRCINLGTVCASVCWSDGKCMLVYTSVNVHVRQYACA